MRRGGPLTFTTCFTMQAQGASALAHKLPGNLIEKAFSRSLDLINPLRELERTPSQVTGCTRAPGQALCWTCRPHASATLDPQVIMTCMRGWPILLLRRIHFSLGMVHVSVHRMQSLSAKASPACRWGWEAQILCIARSSGRQPGSCSAQTPPPLSPAICRMQPRGPARALARCWQGRFNCQHMSPVL